MPKLSVTLEISQENSDFLVNYFRQGEEGVSYIVDAFACLYEKTLKEIKGKLSEQELYMITDVFSGMSLTSHEAGCYLMQECAKEIKMDQVDVKWKVDKEALAQKLSQLTAFQVCCLEIWASSYWHRVSDNQNPELADADLKNHIERLR